MAHATTAAWCRAKLTARHALLAAILPPRPHAAGGAHHGCTAVPDPFCRCCAPTMELVAHHLGPRPPRSSPPSLPATSCPSPSACLAWQRTWSSRRGGHGA
ncbi:hypothetical protein HaLaN_04823 [Haematococcus lacustris]|uniref:Uncharacterized protein n=1 Tax=Haematococcus lacustris TaxID=44745 RepID=A0A699Z2P8_HAELA|nr:hypothetical protein HaLaN_04823 [Haematococcus lacustris]